MEIKSAIGKLNLPSNVEEEIKLHDIEILPIHLHHVLALRNLPLHHKDPFDRILIGQAFSENHTLITRDKIIQRYEIQTLLA